MSTFEPIAKDRDKDLLDATIKDIDIKRVEYFGSKENHTEIQIVITGNIHDDEMKEIRSRSTGDAHDAFDRAMQGL